MRPFRSISTFYALMASAITVWAESKTTLERIEPVLSQYCFDCHNADKHKGDLDLESISHKPLTGEHRAIWEKVAEMMESREMPPEKKPQPAEQERDLVVKAIDGELSRFDCDQPQAPGAITLRRLNREEYRNTVRDLMKVDFDVRDFPNDPIDHGFDNIGDALSLAPMLMEKYLTASEEIVQRAILADPSPKPQVTHIKGDKLEPGATWVRRLDTHSMGFYREGDAKTKIKVPVKGEYIFRVMARGELAGPDAPRLALRTGEQEVALIDVESRKSTLYSAKATMDAGEHSVYLVFLNNYVNQTHADPKMRGDRNVFVDYLEIESPAIAPTLPKSHQFLVPEQPKPGHESEAAKTILAKFATRAYRRPVSDAEVKRLVGLAEKARQENGTFLQGIQLAMQAVLCSPHFLYRWELDPGGKKSGEARPLTDFELASRLSYFLWSSMPDDELFALAEKGQLQKGDNLKEQIVRMLKSERARTLSSNFSQQWLQVRGIGDILHDPNVFPKFDPNLKSQMIHETELFMRAIFEEDRSVLDIISADFTFVNEKMARFYGIENVNGDNFRKVTLPPDSPRGGVITQASVLMATSFGTRTSPVVRGKWILEQLLGTPPPPPPPDIPSLPSQNPINPSAPLRQRLAEHTSRDECASCHRRMDPLGFALENFDATGAWRELDGKFPIDASGRLPNGTEFNGPRELKQVLKNGKAFRTNFVKKMMTYALGRGLTHADHCVVQDVLAAMEKQDNKVSSMITAIIMSDLFLKRKTDAFAGN